MTDFAKLGIEIDSSGAAKASTDLSRLTQAGRTTEQQMGRTESATRKYDQQANAAANTSRTLSNAIKGVAAAISIRQILAYGDSFQELQNKIALANEGMGSVSKTMDELFQIANRNRTAVDGVVTLYQRASMAAKELGADQQEILQFVDLVSKGLTIQGGSAATASGALLQLSQALGSGIVRSEEFNSILEGALPLAQAAARGITEAGGSVSKLRQLIAEGKITSTEFFEGILSQSESLDESFKRLTPTIRSAANVFQNNLLKEFENSQGAFATIAEGILLLADNMDLLAKAAIIAAGAMAALGAAKVITALAAAARAALALNAAAAANPFMALATAAGLAIGAIIAYRDELKELVEEIEEIQKKYTPVEALKDAQSKGILGRAALANYGAQEFGRFPEGGMSPIKSDATDILQKYSATLESTANQSFPIYIKASENAALSAEKFAAMQAKALSIIEANLTPLEKYQKQVAEIDKMLGKGLLTQDQYNRALQSYKSTLEKASAATSDFSDMQARASSIIEANLTPFEKYQNQVAEIDKMLGKGFLSQEQYNRALKGYKTNLEQALAGAETELEQHSERAEELLSRPFENALQSFQSTFTDTVESFLNGTVANTEDAIRRIFTRLAAEIITVSTFQPIVNGMVGGASTGGGGLSIGTLMQGGNLLSGLRGGLMTPSFSSGSFIGSGIDSIGQALGLGNAGFIGPMQPGMSAPLSGAFTPAAGIAGMAGSFLAGQLGLGGGIGGTIGGAVGGIGGTALGASIGAIGGPIGALAGSFLGTALGGAFGGGEPNPHSEFAANLQNLGDLRVGSKHMSDEQAQLLAGQIMPEIAALNQLGIKMPDALLRGGYNTAALGGKQFFQFVTGADADIRGRVDTGQAGQTFAFDAQNPEEASKAMNELLTEILKRSMAEDAKLDAVLQRVRDGAIDASAAMAELNKEIVKQQEEAQKAAVASQERQRLEVELLRVEGNTEKLRQMELDKLQPGNRELQKRIWRIEEEKIAQAEAQRAAAAAEAERQRREAAIIGERSNLENELLRLLGRTDELRNRELMQLDPSNRALQQRIWALQDEKEALDKLSEKDFATLFDFQIAQNRLKSGMGAFSATESGPATLFTGFSSPESAESVQMRSEMGALRVEMQDHMAVIAKWTRKTYEQLNRWDGDGLPEERTT